MNERSAARIDFRSLLPTAVLLPAAIAAIDHYSLTTLHLSREPTAITAAVFVWYIVQIGLVGSLVSRTIAHPLLRWVVFSWVMLLVNILTLTAGMRSDGSGAFLMLPAAVIAGQMGLCVVWLFLGDMGWPIRIPVSLTGMGVNVGLWFAFDNFLKPLFDQLLVIQTSTVAFLCLALWLQRFRLSRQLPASEKDAGNADSRTFQFGLKHVLLWTTALAILLGLARGFDLLNFQTVRWLRRPESVWKLTVGCMAAIGIVVALWAALGRGHWTLRYGIGIAYVLGIGTGLGWWSMVIQARFANGTLVWSSDTWELYDWCQIGWWWLGWIILSCGLLTATLLILRAHGYRLTKIPQAK